MVHVGILVANIAAFVAVAVFICVFGAGRSAWTTGIGRALMASRLGTLGLATGGAWRRVSEWTGDTTWNDTAQVIIGGSWTALAVVAAWQTRQVLEERAGRPSAPIWPDEEAS